MRITPLSAALWFLGLAVLVPGSLAQEQAAEDSALPQDLKLLQGKWELMHGNENAGAPSIRSVKEIQGNRETLRRYDVKSGALTREHSVDFKLTQSGAVRVFTFYPVGGDAKQGQSFIYKVDAENFYDIPGLLQQGDYRNYQESPRVWHWKKVKEPANPEATIRPAGPDAAGPTPQKPAPPPEIPADVRVSLAALGARVTPQADGYGIDLRRKLAFTDKDLDVIIQCPEVVDLTLERVGITDQGLAKLRAMPRLRRLILNDCSISGKGLQTLADLPLRQTLISIGLRGTKVQGDELQWLRTFPKLERVDISQTAITDASVPTLEMLPLKFLNAGQSQISAAALETLQKQHARLVVQR